MSQTSFMLDKSVLPVLTLYSTPHSITKQMAATSISHNDFEKIVDSNQCLVNRSEALVMLIEKLEDAP